MSSRQLAVILFSDIAGYTAMMGEDADEALRILHLVKAIEHELVAQYRGEWIKDMGDGIMVRFQTAIEAVECALEIQRRVNERVGKKLRIGIHLGDVTVEDGDLFGDGVNVASRLESAADPGGIYVSESIEKAIHGAHHHTLQPLGKLRLKHVRYPVEAYALKAVFLSTPHSYQHYKPNRSRAVIIAILLLALIGAFVWNQFFQRADRPIDSMAVLPFDNFSNTGDDQTYFVHGITQSLVARLAKVSSLKVIMNASTTELKEQNASFMDVGRQMGVDAVLSGSVYREGDLIRITTQLVDASSGELVWGESFDHNLTSVLKLQSEVAQAIVSQIEVLITQEELQKIQEEKEVDPEAYDALLKGLFHMRKISLEDYGIAMQYFEKSRQLDSTNAMVHAAIATIWVHLGQWGRTAPAIATAHAKAAVGKALEIDSELPMANAALASIYTGMDWDWPNAVRMYERTIKLNPNASDPYIFFADLLVSLHRNNEALQHLETAIRLDPLNPITYSLKGWVLFAIGQYGEAIPALERSLRSVPTMALSHRCLWTTHHIQGDYEKALEYAIHFYASQGYNETASDLALLSETNDYRETLLQTAHRMAGRIEDDMHAMRVARLYALVGENDLALNWLERAYEARYPSFFSLNVDPHWNSLHHELRFQELLRKMQLTLPKPNPKGQQ